MTNFKHQAITTQELALSGSGYTALVAPDNFAGIRGFYVPFSVGDYADGDTSEIIRIPSAARIIEIRLANPANTGATAVNFGLGRPVVGGAPTILDADMLADTVNMTTVRTNPIGIFGSGTNGAKPVLDPNVTAGIGSPAWLLGGLTSDPGGQVSIVITWTTATTAAGPFVNVIHLILAD